MHGLYRPLGPYSARQVNVARFFANTTGWSCTMASGYKLRLLRPRSHNENFLSIYPESASASMPFVEPPHPRCHLSLIPTSPGTSLHAQQDSYHQLAAPSLGPPPRLVTASATDSRHCGRAVHVRRPAGTLGRAGRRCPSLFAMVFVSQVQQRANTDRVDLGPGSTLRIEIEILASHCPAASAADEASLGGGFSAAGGHRPRSPGRRRRTGRNVKRPGRRSRLPGRRRLLSGRDEDEISLQTCHDPVSQRFQPEEPAGLSDRSSGSQWSCPSSFGGTDLLESSRASEAEGQEFTPEHLIPSHIAFKEHPAHAYWTWDMEVGRWWHIDEGSDERVYAPLDFD